MRAITLMLALLLTMSAAHATIDIYPLESDADRQRFQVLTKELRCPKCQNQNIADSNAPIAQDMRDEVHRLLVDGNSDEQIVDAMIARFGEFVTYRPVFDRRTALLWLTPVLVLLIGIGVVIGLVVRSRTQAAQPPRTLSLEERQRAEDLLK